MKQIAKILILLVVSLINLHSVSFSQGVWTKKNDFIHSWVSSPVSCTNGTKGYVLDYSDYWQVDGTTGEMVEKTVNEFWEYNPTTDSWARKADIPSQDNTNSNLQNGSCFSIGNKIYYLLENYTLGSDYYSHNNSSIRLWEFSPETNTWARKADFAGSYKGAGLVGLSIGSKGYIYIGEWGTKTNSSHNDFWEYDPANNGWTKKADMPATSRNKAAAFSIENKGYVGAGGIEDGSLHDFWQYDPTTDTWKKTADCPGTASAPLSFSFANKGYFGLGDYNTELWEYDQEANSWSRMPEFIEQRTTSTGFSIGNHIYYGFGSVQIDVSPYVQYKNDLWEIPLCDISTAINPKEAFKYIGNSVQFSATTFGTSINYQWQSYNEGIWTNLSNNSNYSGVQSSELSLININNSLAKQYHCVLNDAYCNKTSNTAVLHINKANIQDSLALVDLYNATNGTTWNRRSNWLETGKLLSEWQGVTIANDRVVSLNLSNNNLTGSIPSSFTDLTALEHLDLSTNNITGNIPAGIATLLKLNSLNISNNYYTFENILPFKDITIPFTYSPQQNVGTATTTQLYETETFTISLNVDISLTSNVYNWYKNGQLYKTTTVNTLTIPNLATANAGVYMCKITNTALPALTINSNEYTLVVNTPCIWEVTNTDDNDTWGQYTANSLRWALDQANNSPGCLNIIQFNIPQIAPVKIKLKSALGCGLNTIIDGNSQPANGYTGIEPHVWLTSYNEPQISDYPCIMLGNNSTITGFTITNFGGMYTGGEIVNAGNSKIINNVFYNFKNSAIGYILLNNVINGNIIGTNKAKTISAVNVGNGIAFASDVQENQLIKVSGNIITNLTGDAITVGYDANYAKVRISRNLIYNNQGKAINFANGQRNDSAILAPKITKIYSGSGTGIIMGTSEPNDSVEIFRSTGPQSANEYITTVKSDGIGNWKASNLNIAKGDLFVTTGISPLDDNTSELSDTTGCWAEKAPIPADAGPITGTPIVCQGQASVVYSTAAIANATGYVWYVPNEATITSGDNTNSITVSFAGAIAGGGYVSVYGTNASSEGESSNFRVTINGLPTSMPAINGSSTVSQGQANVTYTVPYSDYATGYAWTLPAGATITSGENTNSIKASFSNTAVSGTISVHGTNSCGNGPASTLPVTVNSLPGDAGPISGSSTVCQGQTGVTYSVPAIANATGYVWSLPNGGTISSGANTNSIIVNFSETADAGGYIGVYGTSANGDGTESSLRIRINCLPTSMPAINGSSSVSQGQADVAYTVPFSDCATGYAWTLPAGATITSGENTNSIKVSFSNTAVSGTISVHGTNSCGNGPSSNLPITVNCATPAAAGLISGSQTVCQGLTIPYNVPPIANATSYAWVYSGTGATINGTGNAITIDFAANATSGNLTVYGVNTCGNSEVSAPYTITVNELPLITTQPISQSVCLGNAASFSITDTGTGTLSYQWRKNSTNISGATNATYNISNIVSGDAANYDCVVTGTCGSATSTSATLSINSPVNITTQPVDISQCAGTNATFSAIAIGSGTLTYQWYKDGGTTSINGATSANYTINNISAADASNYRVSVSNICGGLLSNIAALTVNNAPVISSQPISTTVNSGSSATFTVAATGATSYQWRKNGTNISGATNATYTISNTISADAGSYDVVVSNASGCSVTSNSATLTINDCPLPVILVQPSNRTICPGSTVFQIVTLGNNLTYQWQVSTDGGITFNNITSAGSNPVYWTWTTANLSLSSVTTLNNGYQYRCLVNGSCGSSVTSNVAVLTVNTGTPETPGTIGGPTVVCPNTTNIVYNIAPVANATSYIWNVPSDWTITSGQETTSITVNSGTTGGDIQVKASNSCGTSNKSLSIYLSNPPAILVQPSNRTICPGSTVFQIVTLGNDLTYQWQVSTDGGITFNNITSAGSNPVYWTWTTANLSLSNVTTMNNGYQYRCVIIGSCNRSVTSNSATLTINPTAPAIPEAITGPLGPCPNTPGLTYSISPVTNATSYSWNVPSDWTITSGQGTTSITVTSGTGSGNVAVLATNSCGSSGYKSLSVSSAFLPSIYLQPSDKTICPGGASFSIGASGSGIVAYQWQVSIDGGTTFNNIISGGSSPTYSGWTTNNMYLAGAVGANNGYKYRCVFSASCSSPVTSNTATLTVNPAAPATPGAITGPLGPCPNTPGLTYSISPVTNATSYTWIVPSDWTITSGQGTTSITVTSGTGSGNVAVLATNSCGSSGYKAMSVTSAILPSITTQPAPLTINSGSQATFTVVASGATTYQWRKNGINISGATSATYTIPSTTAGDAGSYDVVVANASGCSVTSNAATLTINDCPLPVITTQPSNRTVCPGNAATFNIAASGAGLTFQWQNSTDNGNTWSNISGATAAGYSFTAPASMNGYQYRCIVSGTCGSSVTSNAATLTVNIPTTITTQPVNLSQCAGTNATFSLVATGAGTLTYQWYRNGGTLINGATSASYTINNINATDGSYYYMAYVTGTCGSANTNAAYLTVNIPPAITTQPSNRAVCPGSAATFNIAASGAGLTFQWQVSTDGGSSFNNITNAGTNPVYSSWNTNSLNIGSTNASNNAYQYRCVVSGSCGSPLISNVATLTVNPTLITLQPTNQSICLGNAANFSITATGAGTLTYQWRKNGTNISGATNATYNILATVSGDAANYDCVVTGTCGTATSNSASLSFKAAQIITVAPFNQNVCFGNPVNFSVTATGTGTLTYQWRKNGTNISGANSSIYAIPSALPGDLGSYDCVVTASCGNVTSTSAVLTINPLTVITSQPISQSICLGNAASFNVIATGTGTLSYQWRKNGTSISGANNATYNIPTTVSGDAANYDCVVTGICGSTTSSAASLSFMSAATITSNPSNQTVCPGSDASFSISATGTALTFQWQNSTDGGATWNNINGATNLSYGFTANASMEGYMFHCLVNGTCGTPATSNAATLSLRTPVAIITQPLNTAVCAGGSTTLNVATTGSEPLIYQWVKNGAPIMGASSPSYTINNISATNAGNYKVYINNACGTVISDEASLSVQNSPVITTNPSNQSVCSGSDASFTISATGTGLTYQWQNSTDGGSTWNNIDNATGILYTVSATASMEGYKYRCVVNGTCGTLTSSVASLSLKPATSITAQSLSQNVCLGNEASFTVSATGSGTLTYQWQKDGTMISGANSPIYTIANTTSGDAANYDCVVTGTCGSVKSDIASLSFSQTTSIVSDPENQIICLGSPSSFNVSAIGTGVLTYQWRKNGNIIPGANNPVFNIATTAPGDAANYDCMVTGTCGSVISNAASLSFNPATAIISQPENQSICLGNPVSFNITATGTGTLSYQWQKNGIDISDATASEYSIPSTIPADAANYSCVVTGTCSSITSNAASLSFSQATAIISQPGNQKVCLGNPANFNITATGTGTLSYQWRKNGANISGAMSSNFQITSTGSGDAANYDCIVTGTCGSASSSSASLSFNDATAITNQPVNQSVCLGNTANFSITATGTGTLGYQWRKNGTSISGATNASYSIASTIPGDAANYDCVVTSTCGPIISSQASLSFLTATAITSQPISLSLCPGSSASFSATAIGTGTLSYQWQKNGIDISGAINPTYNIPSIAAGDAGNYNCMVTGTCGSATSNIASLNVVTATSITSQPLAQSVCPGSNASFSVSAIGANLTYQWQSSTNGGTTWNNVNGATSATYTAVANTSMNGYQYQCILSGACGGAVTSNAAVLTINPLPVITVQPVAQTVCEGLTATFTITATGVNLTYQWQYSANSGATWNNITGASTSSCPVITNIAMNGYLYRCVVNGSCPVTSNTAGLTVTPATKITIQPNNLVVCENGTANFTITATGANLTYQWQTYSGNAWKDINGATSLTYTITNVLTSMTGDLYRCVVSGTCGSVTSNTATLSVNANARIANQPNNQTICEGDVYSFGITANGAGLTYQWQAYISGIWTNIGGAINSSYSAASSMTDNGKQYRCVVTGICSSVTSSSVTLSVTPATRIVTQPINSAVCEGDKLNFSLVATGDKLKYQWQEYISNIWVDINGAKQETYSKKATADMHGRYFRCVVSGTCDTVTSTNVLLTLGPQITTQPANRIGCAGSSVTFGSITAIGVGPFTYQWQLSINTGSTWNDITGATQASYSPVVSASMNGYLYRCIVTGSCGFAATSNAATLSLYGPLSITTQPASLTQCTGTSATFSVTATGGGSLSYQWRKNGTNIPGAYSAIYTITNTMAGDAASYDCLITGTCSSATSTAASLSFNQATVITSQPVNQSICLGSAANFSVAAIGTGTLSYQWRKNSVNIPGAISAIYTIASTAPGDASNYDCIVTGTCGSATSNAAALTFNPATAISAQPANQEVCLGSAANFSIVASGTALNYQWRKNYIDIPGANGISYTISSTTPGDATIFDCIVTGTCGSAISNASSLSFYPELVIVSHPADQNICLGSAANFSTLATGTALNYQWRKNGINIAGATNTNFTIASTIAGDDSQYDCLVTDGCGTTSTTHAALLTFKITTALATQPADQGVCLGNAASFEVTATGENINYQWRKNNINIPGATDTKYSIASTVSTDAANYDCMVTGICGSATSNGALLSFNPETAIASQPVSQSVCLGSIANFTVMATGTGTLSYQWRKDGANILGANSATYTIASTSVSDLANYDCVVTGNCGTTASIAVSLTFLPATIVTTQPVSQSVCLGSTASFSVTATGTGTLGYQWRKNSEDIPGATNASYTIPNTTLNDAANYDCVVTGDCGIAISSAVALTIFELYIDQNPADTHVCENEQAWFKVKASGTPVITYQWQTNTGAGWININDGDTYTGVSTNSLSIMRVRGTMNENSFRCVMGNTICTIISEPANLYMQLYFTNHPSSIATCEQGAAKFNASAIGSTPATYQWQKKEGNTWININDDQVYSGSGTDQLSLSQTPTLSNGIYVRAVATNSSCTVASDSALLSVWTYPEKPVIAHSGNTLIAPDAYNYSWSNSSGIIAGATNKIYVPTANGNYSLQTGNHGCMSIPSEIVNISTNSGTSSYDIDLRLDSLYFDNSVYDENLNLRTGDSLKIAHGFYYGSPSCNAKYDIIKYAGQQSLNGWADLNDANRNILKRTCDIVNNYGIQLTTHHDSTILRDKRYINIDLTDYQPGVSYTKQFPITWNGNNDMAQVTFKWNFTSQVSPKMYLSGDNNLVLCEGQPASLSIRNLASFPYKFVWEYSWDPQFNSDVYELSATTGGTSNLNFNVPRPNADNQRIYLRARYINGGAIALDTTLHYVIMQWNNFKAEARSPKKHELHPYNVTCYSGMDGVLNISATGGSPDYTVHVTNAKKFDVTNTFKANDSLSIDSLKATNYLWRVTDGRGCRIQGNIVLNQPDTLIKKVNITPISKCSGDSSGVIEVQVTDSIKDYYFSIDSVNDNRTGIFKSLYAGEYYANVVRNYVTTSVDTISCYAVVGPLVITEPPPIQFNPKDVMIVSPEIRCHAKPVSIEIFAGGGTGKLHYNIDNGSIVTDNSVIPSILPGHHKMVISDDNQCSLVTEFSIVDIPPVKLSSLSVTDASACGTKDGKISFTIQGCTGNCWSKISYLNDSTSFAQNTLYEKLGAGFYKIQLNDDNGCGSDTFALVNNTISNPDFKFHMNRTLPTCGNANGSIVLSATDNGMENVYYLCRDLKYPMEAVGITYGWPLWFSDVTATINNLAAGKHLLIVKRGNCTQFDTLVIRTKVSPIFSHNLTDPNCWGDKNGMITYSSGGQDNLHISINGKTISENESFSGLPSGKYSVEIKNDQNCKSFETVRLIDPPKLIIKNKLHGNVPCYGDSSGFITYNAEGGIGSYTYRVIAKDTMPIPSGDIHNLKSDLYDIYVEDEHRCITKDTVEILQPMKLTFDADSIVNQACSELPVGKFVIDGYGGTPPYSYSNDNGTTWTDNWRFTKLGTGTYPVVLKDAHNCLAKDTVPIKRLNGLTVEYRTTLSLCKTPLGTAKVVPKDGFPPYSYLWKNSDNTTDSIAHQFAGRYDVVVTDNIGCADTLAVMINDVPGPQLKLLDSEPSKCYHTDDGKLLIGVTSGFAPYTISINDSTYKGIYTDPVVIKNLKPGTYPVWAYDTYGCVGGTTVSSTEPDSLEFIDTLVTNPYCLGSRGGQIHVQGKGGTQPYLYSISSEPKRFISGQFDSLAVGKYLVKLEDFNGCQLTDTFTLTGRDKITAEIKDSFKLCGGQPLVLDAKNPGATYEWKESQATDIDTSRIKTITTPGTYFLKITYSPECIGVDTFTLLYSNNVLHANFLVPNTAFLGDTLGAIDVSWPKPETVTWDIPTRFDISLDKSTDEYKYLIPRDTGVFRVGISASLAECVSEQYKTVTIFPSSERPAEDSIVTAPAIILTVYPNPNDGHFSLGVKLSTVQSAGIKIYDSYGVYLKGQMVSGLSEYTVSFDMAQNPTGVYFIHVATNTGYAIEKVSIIK